FEMLNAGPGARCDDRATPPAGADPTRAAADALRARGLARGRTGIEARPLPPADFQTPKAAPPGADLAAADDAPPAAKAAKGPAEIAAPREAGRPTTPGMEAAPTAAAPGRPDNDVAAAAHAAMARAGSEPVRIEPIVSAGRRAGVPHSPFHRT